MYTPIYVKLNDVQIQTIKSELNINLTDELIKAIEAYETAQINLVACDKKHTARKYVSLYEKHCNNGLVQVVHQVGLKKGYWR